MIFIVICGIKYGFSAYQKHWRITQNPAAGCQLWREKPGPPSNRARPVGAFCRELILYLLIGWCRVIGGVSNHTPTPVYFPIGASARKKRDNVKVWAGARRDKPRRDRTLNLPRLLLLDISHGSSEKWKQHFRKLSSFLANPTGPHADLTFPPTYQSFSFLIGVRITT